MHFALLVAGFFLLASPFARADDIYASASVDSSPFSNRPIVKFDSSGHESVFADEPWQGVIKGLAFDNSGNLYGAHWYSGTIARFDSSGQESLFASGLNTPMGLAFDASGNLYVTSYVDGTIRKFDSGGHGSLFAAGIPWATGLAFDHSGNLYVGSSYGSEQIFKIDSSGHQTLFASSGIANPNNKSVVFGSSTLRAIRDNVISKQTIAVVGVEIDFKSEELEKLITAVQGVKGSYEYNDQLPGDKL